MIKLIEERMYAIAQIYSNKLNSPLNIPDLPELDERNALPKDCMNAGAWFGFIIGFKVCYRMMSTIRQQVGINEHGAEQSPDSI